MNIRRVGSRRVNPLDNFIEVVPATSKAIATISNAQFSIPNDFPYKEPFSLRI
jgi:hypothetical protein